MLKGAIIIEEAIKLVIVKTRPHIRSSCRNFSLKKPLSPLMELTTFNTNNATSNIINTKQDTNTNKTPNTIISLFPYVFVCASSAFFKSLMPGGNKI